MTVSSEYFFVKLFVLEPFETEPQCEKILFWGFLTRSKMLAVELI